jgi:telomere length regulation protein
VDEVFSGLLLNTEDLQPRFGYLLDNLRPHEQKSILESMLRGLEQRYLPRGSGNGSNALDRYKQNISGVARIISDMVHDRPLLEDQLKGWLSTGLGGGIHSIGSRRALLASISRRQGMPIYLNYLPVSQTDLET